MNGISASTIGNERFAVVLKAMAAIFVSLLPPPLHGQSVDYGALEQLFKEPMTTSMNGPPHSASDEPATVEIITAEDIRRSGAKNISHVLRHMRGIEALEWVNDDVRVCGVGAAPTLIAAFVSLDGPVAYKLMSRTTWSVSDQNLTHTSQLQTSGPVVERRVLGMMSIHFYVIRI
jgi:outer membrane receptor for ferrienterochelin and colicins